MAWCAGWLALGLGCSGLFTPGPGSGTRVVVVRHGVVDEANELAVAQGVADILEDRGFLVSVAHEALPADAEDPAMDARWVASAMGAANAVLLSVSTRQLRDGLEEGTDHHEVRLDARVVNLDLEATPAEQTLVFAREDTGPSPVARRTRAHWIEATGGFAVRQLFVTPEVGAVMMGESVPLDEMSAAGELRKRESQVAEAAERAYGYASYCDDAKARVESFADEGLSCVGDPCGGWSLLGVVGDEALVQDARRVMWFGVPVRDHATWSEPPERVLAVDLSSGEERVLLEAQNLYGLGHVLPGATVGTMDWFSASGREGIVGFDVATGERVRTVLLDEGERTDVVSVAPDGSATAWCLRDGGCFLDADTRRGIPTLQGARWVTGPEGPLWVGQDGDELVALAVDGREQRTRLRDTLRDVVAGPDGVGVVVRGRDGACAYAPVDLGRWAVGRAEALPGCPWHVGPLPGGGLVGVAEATRGGDDPRGDGEVVRWRPGDEAWEVLTTGGYREEFPVALADGRTVFNRRLERSPKVYDTEVYRRVVCTVE
jgi:hypothetical protein